MPSNRLREYFIPRQGSRFRARRFQPCVEELESRLTPVVVNSLWLIDTYRDDGNGANPRPDDNGVISLLGAVHYLNVVGGGDLTIGVSGLVQSSNYNLAFTTHLTGNGAGSSLKLTFLSGGNTIQDANGGFFILGGNNTLSNITGGASITGGNNNVSFAAGAAGSIVIDGDNSIVTFTASGAGTGTARLHGDDSSLSGFSGMSVEVLGNRNQVVNCTGTITVGEGDENTVTGHHGDITVFSSECFINGNYDAAISVTGNNNHINDNECSNLAISGDGNEARDNILSGSGQWISIFGDDNVVSGSQVTGSLGVGIDVTGLRNLVDDNAVTGSGMHGISVTGAENTISNNQVIDSNWVGIELGGADTIGNIITGNLVKGSKNNFSGIMISGGANTNSVLNNQLLDNAWMGIEIVGSKDNDIAHNKIAGNKREGISISGSASTGNLIDSNWVGLDADGNALGNRRNGIALSAVGDGNMIIGNVVSANLQDGISLINCGKTRIQDNLVGTKSDGTTGAGTANGSDGIDIFNGNENTLLGNRVAGNFSIGIRIAGNHNTIGGANTGDGNLIYDNGWNGLQLGGDFNDVFGNRIGTDLVGNALGNGGHGVQVGGTGNVIGAAAWFGDKNNTALGNWIAFNTGSGVVVSGGDRNTIRLNHIFMNKRLGIDLAGNYVDRLYLTTPINAGLWHPTIVAVDPVAKTISWMLNYVENGAYTIDVYRDPDNGFLEYAEGKELVTSIEVTATAQHAEFTTTVDAIDRVTATATDIMGNTSEFSLADWDADGLCDTWETETGIDLDGDGHAETVLACANLRHKDVFVEVDAMGSTAFNAAPMNGVLDMVTAAFTKAPNVLVHNPDGNNGVSLHMHLSHVGIQGPIVGDRTALGTDFNKAAADIKRVYFGPSGTETPEGQARLLAYRYVLFAGTKGDPRTSPNEYFSSGATELRGNDVIITLGSVTQNRADPNAPRGFRDYPFPGLPGLQAGTLMHELGHALGLAHTGPTQWGETPADVDAGLNYVSVMNYAYQFPGSKDRAGHSGPSVLDYARNGAIIDWATPTPAANQNYRGMWFVFQESLWSLNGADFAPAAMDTDGDSTASSWASAEVAVAADAQPAVAVPGEDVTLTFTVSNVGGTNATGTTLTSVLPDGLQIVSVSANLGSASFVGQTVSANLGTLSPAQGATVTIVVRSSVTGTFDLTAQAATTTAGDLLSNNQASASVTIVDVVSTVAALPSYGQPSFTVTWSGRSGTPGAISYDIYASVDGLEFVPWLTGTTANSAVFNGAAGHTYSFYSVATDSGAHVENKPALGEAFTIVGNQRPVIGPESGYYLATYNAALAIKGVVVDDPDLAGGQLQVTVTADNGKVTLAGVGLTSITGNGTSLINLTGTLAALNAALAGMTYRFNTDYVGRDVIKITARDQEAAGSRFIQIDPATRLVKKVADPARAGKVSLLIQASNGNDNITVTLKPGTSNTFIVSGLGPKKTLTNVTGRILIYGFDGNDVLNVAPGIRATTRLDGGDGNDTLKSGAGNDLLLGGAGNDSFYGNGGRDILVGGLGADIIRGGAGDDILIGNAISSGTVAVLNSLFAEWGRTDKSYGQRIGHLKAVSGGKNGSNLLNVSKLVEDSLTDALIGGADRDWFLATLGDTTDRSATEILN